MSAVARRAGVGVATLYRHFPTCTVLAGAAFAEQLALCAAECAEEGLARLVQRARESGQLRDDFDPADITLLLLANSGLAGQPRQAALAASRRLLAYLFQAFQVQRPGCLPPPAAMGPALA
ncbi:TetR family transcriptional regulator [Nonomuraea sp. NPDC049028]|uniref:TetR family transcriptional regulator n=1 Tax=Nonomuraea sp. NPDC049028 TaxID=3364348 RepID=UPI00371A94B9